MTSMWCRWLLITFWLSMNPRSSDRGEGTILIDCWSSIRSVVTQYLPNATSSKYRYDTREILWLDTTRRWKGNARWGSWIKATRDFAPFLIDRRQLMTKRCHRSGPGRKKKMKGRLVSPEAWLMAPLFFHNLALLLWLSCHFAGWIDPGHWQGLEDRGPNHMDI